MTSPLGTQSECPNCDDRKCMDCVLRIVHENCRDDCPSCCPAPETGHVAPGLFPQLADALEGLYDVYKPEGVGIWLRGAKRSLDGRSPLDLIRDGEVCELSQMVERMRSGAAT